MCLRYLNSGHKGEAGHNGEDVERVWYCEVREPECPSLLHALNGSRGHLPQCKEKAYEHWELNKRHHHQPDGATAIVLVDLKHTSHFLGGHDLVPGLLILLNASLHLVQLWTKVVEDGRIPLHFNDNWNQTDSQCNGCRNNSGPPREVGSGVE